jgi:hypothetical protein
VTGSESACLFKKTLLRHEQRFLLSGKSLLFSPLFLGVGRFLRNNPRQKRCPLDDLPAVKARPKKSASTGQATTDHPVTRVTASHTLRMRLFETIRSDLKLSPHAGNVNGDTGGRVLPARQEERRSEGKRRACS